MAKRSKGGYDRITPAGKKFYAELAELKKLQAKIGWSASKAGRGQRNEPVAADDYVNKKIKKKGPTVAEVAAWNEFGTEHAPPRPFLRQSIDNNRANINAMGNAQLVKICRGEQTAQGALSALGAMQVGLVQKTIRDGDFEPNAPATIKRKGSDKPLIDTGRMRQSVHYVVAPKDSSGD
jgi:hypothetical protein